MPSDPLAHVGLLPASFSAPLIRMICGHLSKQSIAIRRFDLKPVILAAAACAAFAITLPAAAQDMMAQTDRDNPAVVKLDKERSKLTNRLNDDRKNVSKHEKDVKDAQDDLDHAQNHLQDKQKDLEKARARLTSTQDDMQNLETRYSESLTASAR